jgi:hypothetical protein
MAFPLDIRFIRQVEERLGRKLPSNYAARMRKNNGGELHAGSEVWELYPIRDDSDRKRLKRTCNDVILETANARKWPEFPANALAIGSNGTGDQLVLLAMETAGDYGNEVYWWDHETGELNKLADDFAEFPDWA